jgi:hypothetical protein
MAGYNDFSKSNNAIEAEVSGRYPLSKAAVILSKKLNTDLARTKLWLKENCGGEWHHTSSWYNSTNYYDTNIDDLAENFKENDDDNSADILRAKIGKIEIKEKKEIIYSGCVVNYLEWAGSRKHPVATEIKLENCAIIDNGGSFVDVFSANGKTFKKKKDATGFEVSLNNRKVWF